MYCERCGSKNNINSKFCQNCGIKIEQTASSIDNKQIQTESFIYCSNCGERNNSFNQYCEKCGSAIIINLGQRKIPQAISLGFPISSNLKKNLFASTIGSLIAVASSLVAIFILRIITVYAVIPQYVQPEEVPYYRSLIPGVRSLYLLSLQIPFYITGNGSNNYGSWTITGQMKIGLPVLLLIPTFFLIIGGFIITRREDYINLSTTIIPSILMSLPFAIFNIFLLSIFPINVRITNVDTSSTIFNIHPSFIYVFILSIIWGCLFGFLGGWLKLRKDLNFEYKYQFKGAIISYIIICSLSLTLLLVIFLYLPSNSFSGEFKDMIDNTRYELNKNPSILNNFIVSNLYGYIFNLSMGSPILGKYSVSELNNNMGFDYRISTSELSSSEISSGSSSGVIYFPTIFYLLYIISFFALIVGGFISSMREKSLNFSKILKEGAKLSIFFSPFSYLTTHIIFWNTNISVSSSSSYGSNTAQLILSQNPDIGYAIIMPLGWSLGCGIIGGLLYYSFKLLNSDYKI